MGRRGSRHVETAVAGPDTRIPPSLPSRLMIPVRRERGLRRSPRRRIEYLSQTSLPRKWYVRFVIESRALQQCKCKAADQDLGAQLARNHEGAGRRAMAAAQRRPTLIVDNFDSYSHNLYQVRARVRKQQPCPRGLCGCLARAIGSVWSRGRQAQQGRNEEEIPHAKFRMRAAC